MHADSYFTIGSNHLTGGQCQDYATGASLPGGAYAVISDGCSTGGETDNGARVLTLSTAQAIREHWSAVRSTQAPNTTDWIAVRQRVVSGAARSVLGLRYRDMWATCAYAYASSEGGFAFVQGDGVVAWKYPDGRIGMIRFEWDKNTPFYPAYAEDDYREFIELHGGDVNAERATSEHWEHLEPGGKLALVESRRHTLGDGIRGFTIPQPEGVRFFGVFSDGVTLIDGWEWKDAVIKLLDFRATKGVFVKRQMIWFIRNTQRKGKGPLDDLSYAVIDLKGEEAKR